MDLDRQEEKKALKKKLEGAMLVLALGLCLAVLVYFFLQTFVVASFQIPSDSMKPTLTEGDNILVNKLVVGGQLFDPFEPEREMVRAPALRKIKRDEVVVFYFPYCEGWDSLAVDYDRYFVKRCIAIPGDTVPILKGYFPYDTLLSHSIREFTTLYLPRKGDTLRMDHRNYLFYHKLIAWEQGMPTAWRDSAFYLNNVPQTEYRFRKNYYFMAGDNCLNSQDSRYWGLLPEELIIGKAFLIWRSKDTDSGKIRWDRTMKPVR